MNRGLQLIMSQILWKTCQSTFDYSNKHLEQSLPRDDYKEFLELVIVFLGDAPARGVGLRFQSSGAMHHARWMSKVIYSIKIWRFKAQFKLTCAEEQELYVMCVFAVRVYLKAWVSAPQASGAPYSDLLLLKSLFQSIQPSQSQHPKNVPIIYGICLRNLLVWFSLKVGSVRQLRDGWLVPRRMKKTKIRIIPSEELLIWIHSRTRSLCHREVKDTVPNDGTSIWIFHG